MAKQTKSYRLEKVILDMLKQYCKKNDLTETKAIEIAILYLTLSQNQAPLTIERLEYLANDYEYTPNQIIEIAIDHLFKDRLNENEKEG